MPGRILMVHNYSSWGGNLATVLTLCRGLPAYGFATALAAPAREPYVDRFRAAGVAVYDAEIKGRYAVGAARRYAALVRRERFDVVHTHTRRADFVAALGARSAGAAVVSTQHGQINLDRRTLAVKRDAAARFYSLCLRNLFHRHVAVSGEIAAELRTRCGVAADKVVTILNGIDAAPFEAAAADRLSFRHEMGFPRWAVVATVVASLDSKGHKEILPAVAMLAAEGIDIHLVVAGEGRWGAPLITRQAADLGVAARVHLLGFRDDMPRILAGSDLFVLPTPSEGCSIAILEAMAAALPVVTTPVGGNAELVAPGVTGELVALEDTRRWVETLRALVRDPAARRRFGTAGRARVKLEFTTEKMVRRYADFYRELLQARGGRPA